MELTESRSNEIAESLKKLIEAMNSFSEDELKAVIYVGQREDALGPITDPTKYRAESEAIRGTQIFLRSLLQFKREVKGLGNCR